ncbi:MAG: Na+/H+ antiporter NhaA, partial [Gammaproteobacteria bacterium]|nr:Na+/H+ antiporter NhaA [Gammaproteobacteria bacterium]
RQLVLPTAGAIGGVAIPAAIYAALNWQDPVALKGWAVPTATDIAFALGVLAAVGSRVPVALKVFLMTLAILDDLIAIVIIALVYTSGLSVTSLAAGAAVLALMTILKLCGIRTTTPYIMLGAALWVCVLKSGVHATLAGVATAFFISAAPTAEHPESPLKALLDDLHPWVAFFILPMFAFVNAGIALEGLKLSSLLDPVPLGIALGLLLGKPIGVMACVGLAIVTGLARLPQGVTWLHLFGVALLCGVGFTMSLFVGGLAFAEGGAGYARIDRLGVLVGSGLSAVAGFAVLRLAVGRSST